MFKVKLYLGIGDIILSKSYLLHVAKQQPVEIGLHEALIKSYIRNPKIVDFTYDLLNVVYNEECFTINRNSVSGEALQWVDFRNRQVPENILDLSNTLAPYPAKHSNYICLNTKIRDLNINVLNTILPSLKYTLNYLAEKYTLILMGEKEVEQTLEYKCHPNTIYSLYPYVKDIKCIDATVDKLGNTESNIEKLKEDASLMRHAICTINIGAGGNLSISSSVGKSINFMMNTIFDKQNFLDFKDKVYKNCIVHTDFNNFIHELNKL